VYRAADEGVLRLWWTSLPFPPIVGVEVVYVAIPTHAMDPSRDL
jgi:hypothetical protein